MDRRAFMVGSGGTLGYLLLPPVSAQDDDLEEIVTKLVKEKKFKKAENLLLDARKKKDTPIVQLLLGQVYVETERYTEAIPLLEVAVKARPEYFGPVDALSVAYLETGRFTDMIALLDPIYRASNVPKVKKEVEVRLILAHGGEGERLYQTHKRLGLENHKDWKHTVRPALDHFLWVVEKSDENRDNTGVRERIANLYANLDEYDKSREHFRFCIGQKPDTEIYYGGFVHTFVAKRKEHELLKVDFKGMRKDLLLRGVRAVYKQIREHPDNKRKRLEIPTGPKNAELYMAVSDELFEKWKARNKGKKLIDRFNDYDDWKDSMTFAYLAGSVAYSRVLAETKNQNKAFAAFEDQFNSRDEAIREELEGALKKRHLLAPMYMNNFKFEGKSLLLLNLARKK